MLPEAPPRYACGYTHRWIDFVVTSLNEDRAEWYRQLVEDCPQEGWWHLAGLDASRLHVYRNGRWEDAR